MIELKMDNLTLYEAHERAQEREAAKRPICDSCHEPIYEDKYYDIDGKMWCQRCIDNSVEYIWDDEL